MRSQVISLEKMRCKMTVGRMRKLTCWGNVVGLGILKGLLEMCDQKFNVISVCTVVFLQQHSAAWMVAHSSWRIGCSFGDFDKKIKENNKRKRG